MPHTDAIGDVDPGGQAYPALQLPLQLAVVSPAVAPYEPAAQGPLQPGVARPLSLPYVPMGQLVHAPAPPTL